MAKAKDHNNGITEMSGINCQPEELQGLVGREEKLEAQIKALQAKKNEVRQEIKSKGVTLSVLDAVRKLNKLSPEEQERQESQARALKRMMRMPVGFQTELSFDAGKKPSKDTVRQNEIDYAKNKGFTAGRADNAMKCDYEDQELIQAFNAAWHEGQKVLNDALKTANERDNQKTQDDDALDDNAETDASKKAKDDAEAKFT